MNPERIAVGDLVQIYYRMPCCNSRTPKLMELFVVDSIVVYQQTHCIHCGDVAYNLPVAFSNHDIGAEVRRLRKIPPLAVLEDRAEHVELPNHKEKS